MQAIKTSDTLRNLTDVSDNALPTTIAVAILSLGILLSVLPAPPAGSSGGQSNSIVDAQRCADKIYFFFSDETGKNIDPANLDSILINGADPRPLMNYVERNSSKGVLASTLCPHSLQRMIVEVAQHNKAMKLILKRIPGDAGNIFLYGIPLSEGTFEFDFEWDLAKNCDPKVKQHDECTLSPKRLKKVTPDIK